MEALKLQYVNLDKPQNHKHHRTEGLSSSSLVVRRGQPFRLTLGFSGPLKRITDDLILRAVLDGLHFDIPFTLSREPPQSQWAAQFQQAGPGPTSPYRATVWVVSPATAPVGVYRLQLLLRSPSGSHSGRTGQFALLCNPWCEADSVWLPDENMREEYVRNDFGLLYQGTPKNIIFRPWGFDQYERGILDICMTLLQVSNEHKRNWRQDYGQRADPVYISRVVSAMINCNDDCGVLEGNWSEDSSGGIPPSAWTGSGDILRQWALSRFRPIKYGQCWVFAGVMCTVMRALGIPTRVVTCFNSAHDTNGNLVIEEYYNEAGEKLPQGRDSIWNFHTWVECWMKRPDLGSGLDGWQVLDPTPQERSGGVYRCGPAPVRAVRERRLNTPYDTPFIYAEVNADVCVYVVCPGQKQTCTMDTERVGTLICTKSLGSNRLQDITSTYKHSKDATLNMALSVPGLPEAHGTRSAGGLSVGLHLVNVPVMGEHVTFSVTVTNKDNVRKSVREHVNAQAKSYNSSPSRTLWEARNLIQLAPHESKVLKHQIPSSQCAALGDSHLVNLAVVLVDTTSQERVLASEEFNISSPVINIQVENEDSIVACDGQIAVVTFTNPFSWALSGVLAVTGAGLLEDKVFLRVALLKPGETMETTVKFTPKMAGIKMLHASLRTNNNGAVIRGFKTITVLPATQSHF
ncbi:LOW QUALITY PROTEIN: transglutaminase 5, like [Brachyhypopomus gauderio]|uniref:LOW QUALITY PROTEIN: transglutaminase 5, like n=1 Tax=Brachyhypopomus gauderio TaxID=698409 RepID=UPI004041A59F